MSRKGSSCDLFGGALATRAHSVVLALLLIDARSGRSFGEGVCHAPLVV